MSNGTAGSVIMDATSLFYMAGILIYTSLYRKRGRLDDRLFFAMVLVNMALAVSDGVSNLLEGSGLSYANSVMAAGNVVFYIAVELFPYLYLLYLEYRVNRGEARMRRTKLLGSLPFLLMAVILLVNLKTGWIFSFDENNMYHPGPYNDLTFVPAAIYLLSCLVELFRIDFHLVVIGILVIASRVAWGVWFRGISSTAFTYTLFLVSTHVHVMNRPLSEA